MDNSRIQNNKKWQRINMKICTFFIVLLLLVGIVFFFQQSNIDEYGYGSNLNKISVIREEKIFSPKLSTEGDCFFLGQDTYPILYYT